MIIRPFTAEDIPAIHDIFCTCLREFGYDVDQETIIKNRSDLREIQTHYQNLEGEFWVVEENNAIIGTMGIHAISWGDDTWGFLRRFILLAEYRNSGRGKKMLETVTAFANKKGWKGICFGIDGKNERARGFYLREGFIEFTSDDLPQELIDDNDEWYFQKVF